MTFEYFSTSCMPHSLIPNENLIGIFFFLLWRDRTVRLSYLILTELFIWFLADWAPDWVGMITKSYNEFDECCTVTNFKRTCLLVFGTIIYYFLFMHRISIVSYINLHMQNLPFVGSSFKIRFYNDYYPHLPIHIYTEDLNISSNTSKLILLANPFFADVTWRFVSNDKSPEEISKK